MSNLMIARQAVVWGPSPLALATVIGAWGSAPRPVGSHLLMAADGRFAGSVSGGCVESELLFYAQEVARGAPVFRARYGQVSADSWQAGLPCGGEIDILIQPVRPGAFDPALFGQIITQNEGGRAQLIATDLTTGVSESVEQAAAGQFVNRYAPPRRMLIVGAVDIAQFARHDRCGGRLRGHRHRPARGVSDGGSISKCPARRALARRSGRRSAPRRGYRGRGAQPRSQD